MIVNKELADMAVAKLQQIVNTLNAGIMAPSKSTKMKPNFLWNYREGVVLNFNGATPMVDTEEDISDTLNQYCALMEQVTDNFNKKISEWRGENDWQLEVNFAWGKRDGISQIVVTSVTAPVFGTEPETESILEKFNGFATKPEEVETNAPS